MKIQLNLARNVPDFILQREGAPLQDPRFTVFRAVPLWRYLWIRLCTRVYDSCKEYLRRLEEREAHL